MDIVKPWRLYFSKAVFEGFFSRGAYIWRVICVTKSIGLAYSWKEMYVVLHCFCLALFRI